MSIYTGNQICVTNICNSNETIQILWHALFTNQTLFNLKNSQKIKEIVTCKHKHTHTHTMHAFCSSSCSTNALSPISAFKATLTLPTISEPKQKNLKKKKNTMLIPHYHLSLLLLLLPCLPPHAVAQSTVADCGASLLPLAPCGAFVQGRAAAPVESCCDNVDVLYKRNPTCLCALLTSSGSVSPFPINVSLALQLPLLCKLNNVDPSTCPGMSSMHAYFCFCQP